MAESVVLDLKPMDRLKDSLRRRILKKAINKVAQTIKKDAKGVVPKRTGAYRLSLGSKSTAKKKGLQVSGIIGARSAFTKKIKKTGETVRPVRYAHFLEFGTRHMKARKSLRTLWKSKAKTYIKTAQEIIKQEVRKALSKAK